MQPLGHDGAGVVDAVAEDVQFAGDRRAGVHGGDLDRGHDAHAVALAGGDRLGDAADGVVVGQREQLHAGAAARSTTSAAGRAPSEWVECDCRSKRGATAGSVCDQLKSCSGPVGQRGAQWLRP